MSLAEALPRSLGGMRSAVVCCGTGGARCGAVCSGLNRRRYSCLSERSANRQTATARSMSRRPRGTGRIPVLSDGKIEITLPDGTSVKVGHDVGLVTQRRVMSVLRR
jgi:hypothetical protein